MSIHIRTKDIAPLAIGGAVIIVFWQLSKIPATLRGGVETLGEGVAKAAESVNPTNNQNVFAKTADAAVRTATGGKSESLGSWLYDVFNKE